MGSLLAWVIVLAIGWRALGPPPADPERTGRLLVGIGGIALPTAVLAALLVWTLPMLPKVLSPGPEGPLRVVISGELYWWRVRYELPDGAVESANELHLPVGRRTPVVLRSPDVIHSLWIPSIAGKMDLIPGRTNALGLEPLRTGVFRGACAEYCGPSHTHMGLWAVVEPEEAFAAWLARERLPARPPADPLAARGAEVFLASGCGACHTVRGTAANGTLGPDLTHVGSRRSVGAGLLANDRAGFRDWLARTGRLKPDVHMPTFDVLPGGDLDALAAYLDGLE